MLRNFAHNEEWFGSYLETYVQRDVRSVANIGHLHDFSRFIKLLAANVTCQFNASQYAKNLGVSVPTIQRWLSVLEVSYIIYVLKPYYSNLGKRIVKSPKIYFYDTGLASYLNGAMGSPWEKGPLAGAVFENFIISECIKRSLHQGKRQDFYYFREHNGDEIGLIIESKGRKEFLEIKSSMTFRPRMVKQMKKYLDDDTSSYVIYQGETMKYAPNITVFHYRDYLQGFSGS